MTTPVGPTQGPSFPPSGGSEDKPNAGMTQGEYRHTVDGITTNAALSSPGAKQRFEGHEVKELGQQMKEDRQNMKQYEQEDKRTSLGG